MIEKNLWQHHRNDGRHFAKPELERLLPSPFLNGWDIFRAGQEKVFVQIGVSKIDPVELDVECLQVLPQGEVPECSVIEPLIPLLKLGGDSER